MQLLEGMLFGESFTCFVNEYNIHLRDTLLEVAERSEKMMTRISFAGRLLSQCRCCQNSTKMDTSSLFVQLVHHDGQWTCLLLVQFSE